MKLDIKQVSLLNELIRSCEVISASKVGLFVFLDELLSKSKEQLNSGISEDKFLLEIEVSNEIKEYLSSVLQQTPILSLFHKLQE